MRDMAAEDTNHDDLDQTLDGVTTEQLAAMGADDLDTLAADLRARTEPFVEKVAEKKINGDELAVLASLVDAIEMIDADLARRETEADERATKAADLLAKIASAPEPDPEPEVAPEVEPVVVVEVEAEAPVAEADPEPEPAIEAEAPAERIAAAAPVARRVEARGNPTKPVARPAKVDERLVLRASANAGRFGAGELLNTPEKVFAAFDGAVRASVGYRGPEQHVPVCSLGVWDAAEIYGEERTLRYNARDNDHRIKAHLGSAGLTMDGQIANREALRASGGICAPPPIRYDQPVIGTNARPVRDTGVVMFGADRGGIRTLPPPHLADVTGAITTWTEANDIALNSPSTKSCLTLTCPDEEETLVDAIVSCAKVGNYRQMFWGEQVVSWMSKIAQQAAKVAETKFLTAIGTGSTQVHVAYTGNQLGTTREILSTLDRATSQIRNRHRLDPEFPFRFMAPAWLQDNMITDLTREQPGSTAERLATSDAELNRFLTAKGINITWFLDGETGQIYGSQADGALNGWKSHAICYLYPEGQWLGLDGGSLDFGLVRDSTLNATNDFQLMSEFFENVHQIHLADSYRLDIDICASGKTSLPISIDPCTAES